MGHTPLTLTLTLTLSVGTDCAYRSALNTSKETAGILRTSPDILLTSPGILLTSPDILLTSPDILLTSPDIVMTQADNDIQPSRRTYTKLVNTSVHGRS